MGEVIHSPIGASSMYRWSKCPGSVKLSVGIESKSSSYAEEGTLAHDIAAGVLMGDAYPNDCTEEMKEAIEVYVQLVKEEAKTAAKEGCLIEKAFDLGTIHPGLYGTADCVIFDDKAKTLKVIDYKHGAGIPVEVENNLQLLYYGLGALLSTKFPADRVELIVCQPRCEHPDGPIRRWSIETMAMFNFIGQLKNAAEKTEDPNAPLVPGDHCRFCPASGVCPSLQEKALAMAKEEFAPAKSYDPNRLSQILEWLPRLEAWAKNVREFAYREAEHGRTPPGYKLVQKRATRKWKNETEAEKAIEKFYRLSHHDFHDTKIKSPAAFEKLVGKKDFKLIEDQIEKVSSGNTLVPESDKRPQIESSAVSDFEQLT